MIIAKVIKAGLFSVIQDSGRIGFLSEGVPASGPMDTYSAALANLLVGNHSNEPLIEMTMSGMTIGFLQKSIIGITGGKLKVTIDGQTADMYKSLQVLPGQVLSMDPISNGFRSYFSVSGGILGEEVLGSRSTYVRSAWGGLEGRALKKGDHLNRLNDANGELLRQIPEHLRPVISDHPKVRFIEGPEWDEFSPDFQGSLSSSHFEILPDSDRMGIRMKNAGISSNSTQQMISSPVTCGTIQVTPVNQLIILMSDGQTCGGYPRIGNVITVDLPKLAQVKTRDSCSFIKVSLEEAHELLKHQKRKLASLVAGT